MFEEEPPVANNPLFEMDNVVVTPHIGGEDTLSVERMGIEAAELSSNSTTVSGPRERL